MNAVFFIVSNWRWRDNGPPTSPEELAAHIPEHGEAEDPEAEEVPLGEFTVDRLREADRLNVAALKTWGLTCNQRTPDVDAIHAFLDDRYGHSTDDVDHADPLDPGTWGSN